MDEGREELMATPGDDTFPPLERLLGDSTGKPAETDAVRARAVELLRSMDEFQVPLGRKQRLLFRLGQGHASRARRVGWLRPVVIGAFLMGIGGGAIASVSLTRWPAWIVRSYQQLVSGPKDPARPAEPIAPARRLPAKVVAIAPAPLEATVPPPVVPTPRRAQV